MKNCIKHALVILILSSCRQIPEKEMVIAIPGLGLIHNTDTIRLEHSELKDILKSFDIKNPTICIDTSIACGYTLDGEPFSRNLYRKRITYKGIVFQHDASPDKQKLEAIEIKENDSITVKINDSIVLGKPLPDLHRYFRVQCELDEIRESWANLPSYGVDFISEVKGPIKKLTYIHIYAGTGSN